MCFYLEDGQDYHRLMRVADKNMYLEKKSRKRILQTQKKEKNKNAKNCKIS